MKNIVEIKNTTLFQGSMRVFHKLNLEVSGDCSTVVLGPNGSGKSTLLKLINRDLYPVVANNSYVKLFGRESWDVQELRAKIGIVSHSLQQNYSGDTKGLYVLLSGYYASDGVWQHQNFDKEKIQYAHAVAEKLKIEHLLERHFSSMSTGEQRRFLLGRALVNNPPVLALDEPTSGLDLSACFQYLEIIRDLLRVGVRIVLVTHHVHEIPPEIDRVVFMKKGQIVADETKNKLLCSDKLSELYDCPIRVVRSNGFYQAFPG